MLIELSIRNFAIIEYLDLPLQSGFSVVTGETGAGKSIMVDALAVLLGDRAETDMIKQGANQCELSALFDVSNMPAAQQWLRDYDLIDEDNTCLLRRVLLRQGRSRGYINGSPQPLSLLKVLGEKLIDIHGQHAHQSLLKRDQQRALLDQYAQVTTEVTELGSIYQQLTQIQQQIEHITLHQAERQQQADFIHFQLQELQQLAPQPNEWQQITERHQKLAAQDQLQIDCASSLQLLGVEHDGLLNPLRQVCAILAKAMRHDPALHNIHAMLESACIQCEEAAHDLSAYAQDLILEPTELVTLEARMSSLNDLARKHRVATDELPALILRLQQDYATLHHGEQSLAELHSAHAQHQAQWQKLAEKMSQARHHAVHNLNQHISDAMTELGMSGGQFIAQLVPSQHMNAYGLEDVQFLVSANPGQAPRPLNKVASGGELARISLAIQVILSLQSALPTLIFDEVDSGIGGAIAEMVGHHLRQLSAGRQVLCVTHLPQVAALAHQHYQVEKQKEINSTHTTLHLLDHAQRVHEIARMLGGVKITDATLSHAQEMLVQNR